MVSKYLKSSNLGSSSSESKEKLVSTSENRLLIDGYTQSDLDLFNELASPEKMSSTSGISRNPAHSPAPVVHTQYTEQDHAHFKHLTAGKSDQSDSSGEHPIALEHSAGSVMTTSFGNPFAKNKQRAAPVGEKLSTRQISDT